MKAKYLLILITLIQFNWIRSQVSYDFKLYTKEDGLISNTCYKLFQDSKGYLWIANGSGVSKFNGKKFETYIDKNFTGYYFGIEQFIERTPVNKNNVLATSGKFIFYPFNNSYQFSDSAVGVRLRCSVDKDLNMVHHFLSLDSQIVNGKAVAPKVRWVDTISYKKNGVQKYCLLPDPKNNHGYEILSDNKNNVYVCTQHSKTKQYSYFLFSNGKLIPVFTSRSLGHAVALDNKSNYLLFIRGEIVDNVEYYSTSGKFLITHSYDPVSYYLKYTIDKANFIWIPTEQGLAKINEQTKKEYIDNDRNAEVGLVETFDANGEPYLTKSISKDNYNNVAVDRYNHIINGDRVFDGQHFMDLLEFKYLSNITPDENTSKEKKSKHINDIICDRENNIWMATNEGVIKFTPVPLRNRQDYESKLEYDFKLRYTDCFGRKFFLKTDEINRKLYLKIIKDTVCIYRKTISKTPLSATKSSLADILEFYAFGKYTALYYNNVNYKYSFDIFDDKEIKSFETKTRLLELSKVGDTLMFRNELDSYVNGNFKSSVISIVAFNEKFFHEKPLIDFWQQKLQLSPLSDTWREVERRKNCLDNKMARVLFDKNLTVFKIKSNFEVDTTSYGNLPLRIRYNLYKTCKINLPNYDLLVIDSVFDIYLVGKHSYKKITLYHSESLFKKEVNENSFDYEITTLNDLLIFKKHYDYNYTDFSKPESSLLFKLDTNYNKLILLKKLDEFETIPNRGINYFSAYNNYFIVNSSGSNELLIYEYNDFKKFGLQYPTRIKIPAFEGILKDKYVNYFNNCLDSAFFNKVPPIINIFNIQYSKSGQTFNDTLTDSPNYSASITNLTFNYDAVSLTEGDYIQTKYNVLGFDTTWQTIKTNDIVFSSLPAGSYTLQIKACNNHNYWSEPKQFSFTIDFPWYRTWLAYILYVVVGGGVIYLFIKSRTKKLEEEKENLEKIVEERTAEVVEEKKVITEQKHLIEEKHREITDSINYAERIQRSFLATKEQLDNNLSDYFILFKPKDVVSGDFYWSHTLQNGNFALVTADSTGHGVPGAIMSLLNTSSIERAVELGISEPAEILNHTRQTIIERLKKDGSAEGGKDGMDCSLISFNKEKSKFAYAAANNPIWIIRNKELIELAPDKIPVGKHDRDSVSFTQHEVEIQKGDMIYTLTDGFPDQFGGPKGKKFMYKKLKEMLITIAHKPTAEQQTVLKGTLKDWMGNTEQVDDVTIIGVRV